MTLNMKKFIPNLSTYLILSFFALSTILPFYWMVTTSLKTDMEALAMPPKLFPWPLYFQNFPDVFRVVPMLQGFINSSKVALITVVGVIFSCSLAAYSFSKIKFKGSNILFGMIIATMLIPSQVTMIPLYVIFSKMGWVDTHLPLIVPHIFINAYGVFLINQFMSSIPDSYIEAAQIDGGGHFMIYSKIVLPLCKPALVTLGLFTFIWSWNSFLVPLIYLNTDTKFTITIIINSLRNEFYLNWGLMMAAASVAILPIAIVYFIGQKFFIEGIALSGLKA